MSNAMKLWGKASSSNIRKIATSSPNNDAWLSRIFVRKIEPTKESHSRMLGDKEVIYALQTHNFRPSHRRAYLDSIKQTVDFIKAQNELADSVSLVGSFTVKVGDQDQALNLWKFMGGFEKIDRYDAILSQSAEYEKINDHQSNAVRSRHLQYLLAFSYWPEIIARQPSNIYEIRSYALKPGTMIEWGNNWARAINYRQNNAEAFAGFFSQIGRLYNVHHIWCYKDLNTRKETRESAWRSPGWDECVAYTVPLIREMHCRILVPTEFSPTQ